MGKKEPKVNRTMTARDWSSMRHFKAREFIQPLKMTFKFMAILDDIRELAKTPMTISSSYRTPPRNAAVGGVIKSAHKCEPCSAVDILVKGHKARWSIIAAATRLGIQRIGIGSNFIHLDAQPGHPAPRIWHYYASGDGRDPQEVRERNNKVNAKARAKKMSRPN